MIGYIILTVLFLLIMYIFKSFGFVVIGLILIWFFVGKIKPGKTKIDLVMGKTGIGKTTYLALQAKKYIKKGYKVFSNVEIAGTYKIDAKKDIGTYLIQDALLIIDEAGNEYNARDWKAFGENLFYFFTHHRHFRTHVIISVQYWDRVDITIRELIHAIYVVAPCIHRKWLMKVKEIGTDIDINTDHQIIQKYFWIPFWQKGVQYYFRPSAWSLFQTHNPKELKEKDWEYWHEYEYQSYVHELFNSFRFKISSLKFLQRPS